MRPGLIYWAIVAAVLVGALVLRVIDPAPVARLRYVAFDTYQQLSPRPYDPDAPVRIVEIDETSLARIGQWPWPRTVLTNLTRKLKELGAAAIGFDLVFAEADRLSPDQVLQTWSGSLTDEAARAAIARLPAHDPQFAFAIGETPVVLGFVGIDQKGLGPPAKASFAFAGDDPTAYAPHFEGAATSLPVLTDKALGSGALNWLPDSDQIIRRMPLMVEIGGKLYPSFAAEVMRLAFGAPTFLVKSSNASGVEAFGEHTGISALRIGEVSVPTDAQGQIWMHFTPHEPQRFVPAWKVLAGEVAADELTGRIVLVGASAAGLLDLRSTAIDGAVPGVEIHAQAVEQMLAGAGLQRPDFTLAAELLYLLLTGLFVAFLTQRAGAGLGAAVGALSLLGVTVVSWFAFTRWGWLIDPVYPSLAITLLYILGTVYLYLRTEGERRRVRSAFSFYMAPAMVERLAADPSRLELGGENRELTLLFADVRGFTGISEGLDAQQLIRFVNRLFTPLSNIILEQKGTIDKYMGDAVMAFWNAPLDDPDHIVNACHSALRMQEEMERLNVLWAKEAEAAGTPFQPVHLGIGVNTGMCCVGNLGSEQRFDYSVIGDDVNVASRLEGLTKAYGVPIIVGEQTAQGAPHMALLEIESISVRGKRAASRIFALIGDEDRAASDDFKRLKAAHDRLLAALALGRIEDGRAALADCRALGGGALAPFYEIYEMRFAAAAAGPAKSPVGIAAAPRPGE